MEEISLHEFYLKHCSINGKQPEYRDSDKHYFEMIEFANTNNMHFEIRKQRTTPERLGSKIVMVKNSEPSKPQPNRGNK